MFNPLYKSVKGLDVIAGACDSCAETFGVTETVKAFGINSLAEAEGHFSIAKLIKDDFQIITL